MDSTNPNPSYTVNFLVDLLGVVACFFGGTGALWSNLDACWKASSDDLAVQPYGICYGIWQGCAINSDGSWVCDGFFGKTIFDRQVSARQHYCRAATISAVILFSFALFCGSLGSACCKVKMIESTKKSQYHFVSGWMSLFGGIASASAGGWYLWEIYQERIWYHQMPNAGLGYTVGRGIYLALASGLLGLIAGFCFFLSRSLSRKSSAEDNTPDFTSIPRSTYKRDPTRTRYKPRKDHLSNGITDFI